TKPPSARDGGTTDAKQGPHHRDPRGRHRRPQALGDERGRLRGEPRASQQAVEARDAHGTGNRGGLHRAERAGGRGEEGGTMIDKLEEAALVAKVERDTGAHVVEVQYVQMAPPI